MKLVNVRMKHYRVENEFGVLVDERLMNMVNNVTYGNIIERIRWFVRADTKNEIS